jgi:hypothetical protein
MIARSITRCPDIMTAAAHAGSPAAPAPEASRAKHTHAEATCSALNSGGRHCGGSVPASLSWASTNSSTVSGQRCELPPVRISHDECYAKCPNDRAAARVVAA